MASEEELVRENTLGCLQATLLPAPPLSDDSGYISLTTSAMHLMLHEVLVGPLCRPPFLLGRLQAELESLRRPLFAVPDEQPDERVARGAPLPLWRAT